jgi:hypothetical protein
MNAALSTRVAAGVTATYVRDLSRHPASAPSGGRRVRSDELDARHSAARPARREHSVGASRVRAPIPSRVPRAAGARRPAW